MSKTDTAVIDLGSNTIKLVIYKVREDGTFRQVQNESVHAQLAENQDQTGFLDEQAMDRTISALLKFRRIVDSMNLDCILPVATSAVREAANGTEFIERMLNETEFHFRVLSTSEEALRSYFGAVRSLRIPSMIFFDLGGGSLEIVHSKDFAVEKVLSMPLGALRITQMYADEPSGSFSDAAYDMMRARISDLILHKDDLDMEPGTVLVGAGGTMRNMVKFHQSRRNYPFLKFHNYTMSRNAVSSICDMFQKMTPKKIAKIKIINSERAKTITAGTCVVDVLMESLGFGRLATSAQALREGMLRMHIDYGEEYANQDVPKDLMRQSLYATTAPDQLPAVMEDILRILEEEHLSERERSILSHALAHTNISSENSDDIISAMMGSDSHLSHREQLISSMSVVEYGARGSLNKLADKFGSILRSGDKKLTRKISALLAVWTALDAARDDILIGYVPGGISLADKSGSPLNGRIRAAAKWLSESLDIRVECD